MATDFYIPVQNKEQYYTTAQALKNLGFVFRVGVCETYAPNIKGLMINTLHSDVVHWHLDSIFPPAKRIDLWKTA